MYYNRNHNQKAKEEGNDFNNIIIILLRRVWITWNFVYTTKCRRSGKKNWYYPPITLKIVLFCNNFTAIRIAFLAASTVIMMTASISVVLRRHLPCRRVAYNSRSNHCSTRSYMRSINHHPVFIIRYFRCSLFPRYIVVVIIKWFLFKYSYTGHG